MEEMEEDTNNNNNNEDPYGSMLHFTPISSSQEQLLHRTPFVGDTPNHNSSQPVDFDLPVASAGIIMASLPETQTQDAERDSSGGPQDVFHTPPEESSLHSSDDQRRMLTVDIDVDRCAVNQAVDVGCGTQGFVDGFSDGSEFVDLGRDSELGFSETRLTQEIDIEIPECHQFDEFRVFENEFSELPVKKLKLSEQNVGFDSSRDCFGVQVEAGMENCDADAENSPCNFGAEFQPQENVVHDEQMHVDDGNEDDFCREISMDKNFENQVEVGQLETTTSAGGINKSSDEVIEASGMRNRSDDEPCLRVLPSSIRCRLENASNELGSGEDQEKENVSDELGCGEGQEKENATDELGYGEGQEKENASNELGYGEGQEKKKCPVFDVLRILSENTDEVGEDLNDVSLLEAAKLGGITFPRPRWWPDNDSFNNIV